MVTPIPPALRSEVERYVQSELSAAIQYENRAPLDSSGVYSLRRLVEQAYAHGYNDGYGHGHADQSFNSHALAELREQLAEGGESR